MYKLIILKFSSNYYRHNRNLFAKPIRVSAFANFIYCAILRYYQCKSFALNINKRFYFGGYHD